MGSDVNIEGARKQAEMKDGEGELPVITNDENCQDQGVAFSLACCEFGVKYAVSHLAMDRPFTAYKSYARPEGYLIQMSIF